MRVKKTEENAIGEMDTVSEKAADLRKALNRTASSEVSGQIKCTSSKTLVDSVCSQTIFKLICALTHVRELILVKMQLTLVRDDEKCKSPGQLGGKKSHLFKLFLDCSFFALFPRIRTTYHTTTLHCSL